jgi:hypothetical protein
MEEKVLLIDADSLCYHSYMTNTIEEAKEDLENKITNLGYSTGIQNMEFFLTIGKNFRYDLIPGYKENRKLTHKPKFVKELRQMLIDNYKATFDENLEADDLVIDKYRSNKDKYVIASIDKDVLYNTPGRHYNLYSKSYVDISPEYAHYHYHKQIIVGDPTDNIPNLIKLLGDKRLDVILEESGMDIADVAQYICNKIGVSYIDRHKVINCGRLDLDNIQLIEYDDVPTIDNYICYEEKKYRVLNKKPFNKNEILYFGKYKGKSIRDIYNSDWQYFKWLQENIKSSKLKEAIENLLDEKI